MEKVISKHQNGNIQSLSVVEHSDGALDDATREVLQCVLDCCSKFNTDLIKTAVASVACGDPQILASFVDHMNKEQHILNVTFRLIEPLLKWNIQ